MNEEVFQKVQHIFHEWTLREEEYYRSAFGRRPREPSFIFLAMCDFLSAVRSAPPGDPILVEAQKILSL